MSRVLKTNKMRKNLFGGGGGDSSKATNETDIGWRMHSELFLGKWAVCVWRAPCEDAD